MLLVVLIEVPPCFFPEVLGFEAFAEDLVRGALDCDVGFLEVGVDVLFRVSLTGGVRIKKKKQDGFEGPPLRVDFDVELGISVFLERHSLYILKVVVYKRFAVRVRGQRLVCQRHAPDGFILQLHVCQFVIQFILV